MSGEAVRGGRCACGAVRYETTGAPRRVSVCHCKACQRRTGSAFGIAAGTLDDTSWLAPKLHVWAGSAQGWLKLPEDAEVLQQSNIGQTT